MIVAFRSIYFRLNEGRERTKCKIIDLLYIRQPCSIVCQVLVIYMSVLAGLTEYMIVGHHQSQGEDVLRVMIAFCSRYEIVSLAYHIIKCTPFLPQAIRYMGLI